MDEVKLSSRDYRIIGEQAQRHFLQGHHERGGTYEGFLSACIIKAFISYLISQGWELHSDGKIHKKAESQE